MIVSGVDEAGRGPVFGPLVICCISFSNDEHDYTKELLDLGVRDSKQLPPHRRERLYNQLVERALEYRIIEISPAEIDSLRKTTSLNEIEAIKMADALNLMKNKPNKVFIDAADVNERRFGANIAGKLNFLTTVVAKHRADQRFPIVSASSIIAKVTRDQRIQELKSKYGDVGSGYPSDPTTISFLKKWVAEKGTLPEFARKSWDTSKRILAENSQQSLLEY